VIQGNIPVTLILVGVLLGLSMELLCLPVLPFALGLYLPLSLSTAMMLGGIVSFFVKKREKTTHMTTASEKGILAASGLVAGDACTGVIIALLTILGIIPAIEHPFFSNTISLSIFLLLAAGLGAICFYKRDKTA
ncbi:MAG: OPT/YSL family transporter, partial [Verrucomicrobiota bacterium]